MSLPPYTINQLLPSYSGRDAVGNHVTLIRKLLRERNFESEIFAEQFTDTAEFPCHHVDEFFKREHKDSITIYQYSVGSDISRQLLTAPIFLVTNYHNITPPEYFFDDIHGEAFMACSRGRMQSTLLRNCTDMTWSVSQYNEDELHHLGFTPNRAKFPVLRDYGSLLMNPPDQKISEQLNSKKNILFVGRASPHKGHIDLIFAFHLLKQQSPHSNLRLILIGGGHRQFIEKLADCAREMGLSVSASTQIDYDADVVFVEGVTDSELAQYYRSAEVFACLSDHEGFCVPVVEAMTFGLPIIAHKAAAVPETLGEAGILVDKNNLQGLMNAFISVLDGGDKTHQLRESAIKRAKAFAWPVITKQFDIALEQTILSFHEWRTGRKLR
jgi:glycosyltransferase involved in cell wall biosynthesis